MYDIVCVEITDVNECVGWGWGGGVVREICVCGPCRSTHWVM